MTTKTYTNAEAIAKNEMMNKPFINEDGTFYAIHVVKTFYGEVESDREVMFVGSEKEAQEQVAKRTAENGRNNATMAVKYFHYYAERNINL